MHLTAPQILQERFEYKASVCCYDLQSTIIGVCHNKVCWSNPLHTDSCRKLNLFYSGHGTQRQSRESLESSSWNTVRCPDFKRALITHWTILIFQSYYTPYQNSKKAQFFITNFKHKNTVYLKLIPQNTVYPKTLADPVHRKRYNTSPRCFRVESSLKLDCGVRECSEGNRRPGIKLPFLIWTEKA